jgi:type IV pilus assembly protein PilE
VRKARGFTLIELMVVVAVVAIIAAVALPAYFAQIRHSRRSEVQGAMQAAALAEERVRADCTTYASAATTSTTAWTSGSTPAGCASTVTLGGYPYTNSYYTVTIPVAGVSPTGYTIQAVPVGTQAKDSSFGTTCNTLTYVLAAGQITKSPSACW